MRLRLMILISGLAVSLWGCLMAASSVPAQRNVMVNPRDGLNYVWISPGTFQMGCSTGDTDCGPQEKPVHPVTLTRGFWIGQTLVTQAAYQRLVGSNPSYTKGERLPVESVSWGEARAYCEEAGMRLPTDAEWEYAARGGSPAATYAPLIQIAWYSVNSSGAPHEVAQKQANAYGLFDILGDTWEWVNDWYDEQYYQNGPRQDPRGPANGESKVLRGGSWYDFPKDVRVSNRDWLSPNIKVEYVSFRCVREANVP